MASTFDTILETPSADELTFLDELPPPASSLSMKMPKKVVNRKGGKARAGSVTTGINTTADTGVQAAIVAISQVMKDRRCAVCTYEATSDTELGVHYVHEHRAGAPSSKKWSRLPKEQDRPRRISNRRPGRCGDGGRREIHG